MAEMTLRHESERRVAIALAASAALCGLAAYAPPGGGAGTAQVTFSVPSPQGEQTFRLMQPECPRGGDWKVAAIFDPMPHGYDQKGPIKVRPGVRTYLKATWDLSSGTYSLGCISQASFVPEAGRRYRVVMNLPARPHGTICPILVADQDTGVAPPSYLARSTPPKCG